MLASVAAQGIFTDEILQAIRGGVRWIAQTAAAVAEPSYLPDYYVAGKQNSRARLAWCYGDIGAAGALAAVGAATGLHEATALSERLANSAVRLPPISTQPVDTCLCHGTAGIAHVYARLHQLLQRKEMLEAAQLWYHRTLELNDALAGHAYRYLAPNSAQDDGPLRWRDETGFMTGAAGTGLALLAALSPVEPAWDALLTISPIIPTNAAKPR